MATILTDTQKLEGAVVDKIVGVSELWNDVTFSDFTGIAMVEAREIIKLIISGAGFIPAYGKYNSTVKTIMDLCKQAGEGVPLSEDSQMMMRLAIGDLERLLEDEVAQ